MLISLLIILKVWILLYAVYSKGELKLEGWGLGRTDNIKAQQVKTMTKIRLVH